MCGRMRSTRVSYNGTNVPEIAVRVTAVEHHVKRGGRALVPQQPRADADPRWVLAATGGSRWVDRPAGGCRSFAAPGGYAGRARHGALRQVRDGRDQSDGAITPSQLGDHDACDPRPSAGSWLLTPLSRGRAGSGCGGRQAEEHQAGEFAAVPTFAEKITQCLNIGVA